MGKRAGIQTGYSSSVGTTADCRVVSRMQGYGYMKYKHLSSASPSRSDIRFLKSWKSCPIKIMPTVSNIKFRDCRRMRNNLATTPSPQQYRIQLSWFYSNHCHCKISVLKISLNVGTFHAITQTSHHGERWNDTLKTGSFVYISLCCFCWSLLLGSVRVKRQSFNWQNCQLSEAVPCSQSADCKFGDSLCSLRCTAFCWSPAYNHQASHPSPSACFIMFQSCILPLFWICHVL